MKKLLLLIAFAGLPLLAGCPPLTSTQENQKRVFNLKKHLFFEEIYTKPFSPELLKEAIYYLEIRSPEIAFRQAVHETGNFRSDIFKQGFNCFGMRYARVRPTKATGIYKHHAKYDHWLNSVIDYKLWQDFYIKKGHDLRDYYTFLKDLPYATDKRYISKLKSIV